jgi:hypothetical protein
LDISSKAVPFNKSTAPFRKSAPCQKPSNQSSFWDGTAMAAMAPSRGKEPAWVALPSLAWFQIGRATKPVKASKQV